MSIRLNLLQTLHKYNLIKLIFVILYAFNKPANLCDKVSYLLIIITEVCSEEVDGSSKGIARSSEGLARSSEG